MHHGVGVEVMQACEDVLCDLPGPFQFVNALRPGSQMCYPRRPPPTKQAKYIRARHVFTRAFHCQARLHHSHIVTCTCSFAVRANTLRYDVGCLSMTTRVRWVLKHMVPRASHPRRAMSLSHKSDIRRQSTPICAISRIKGSSQ